MAENSSSNIKTRYTSQTTSRLILTAFWNIQLLTNDYITWHRIVQWLLNVESERICKETFVVYFRVVSTLVWSGLSGHKRLVFLKQSDSSITSKGLTDFNFLITILEPFQWVLTLRYLENFLKHPFNIYIKRRINNSVPKV